MADGAVKQGVPRQMALQFAAQTVLGAAKTVLTTQKHPATLRDEVRNAIVFEKKKLIHMFRTIDDVDAFFSHRFVHRVAQQLQEYTSWRKLAFAMHSSTLLKKQLNGITNWANRKRNEFADHCIKLN